MEPKRSQSGEARDEDAPPLKLLKTEYSKQIPSSNVYQLYLRNITKNPSFYVQEFGENQCSYVKENKVIMVVGATGAGKTTLINSLVNYVFRVEREDTFRFQLVPRDPERSQSQSQTECVRCYTIHHEEGSTIDYTLTIIDTPGFCDTGGISRDEETVKQIQDFLSSEYAPDHIDGVGFVVNSTESRLSGTQTYLFGSIMSLFGSDIKDNMFLMLTFSDCKDAPILSAVRAAKVPVQTSFRFNNSAVFESTEEYDEADENEDVKEAFEKIFWELGMNSFGRFTQKLSEMHPKGLSDTKEVLHLRQDIKRDIQKLRGLLQECISEQKQLKQYLNKPGTYVTYNSTSSSVFVPINTEEEQKELHEPSLTLWERFVAWLRSWFRSDQRNTTGTRYGSPDRMPSRQDAHSNPVRDGACSGEHPHNPNSLDQQGNGTARQRSKIESKIESIRKTIMGLLGNMHRNIVTLRAIAMQPDSKSVVDYLDSMIIEFNDESYPDRQTTVRELQRFRNCSYEVLAACNDGIDPFAALQKALEAWTDDRDGRKLLDIWSRHMHSNYD